MVKKIIATPLKRERIVQLMPELFVSLSNSPHEKASASSLCATIVAISIRSLSTNAAQQAKRDEHENDKQNGAYDKSAVVTINAVLSNVIIGSVKVTERIVSSNIRNAINLPRQRVADIEHRLADFLNRHFDFRYVGFNDVLDLALYLLHLPFARVDSFLETAVEQSLNILDDISLIRKLGEEITE